MHLIHQLKDEELTDLLLEADEPRVQELFPGLAQSLQSATGQPVWFWQKQAAAIRGRLPGNRPAPFRPAMVWASILALFLLAALLLKSVPAPPPVQAPNQVQNLAPNDSDQQLLIAVETAVQSDVPDALEPASLLASEINNGTNSLSRPRPNHKETHNDE